MAEAVESTTTDAEDFEQAYSNPVQMDTDSGLPPQTETQDEEVAETSAETEEVAEEQPQETSQEETEPEPTGEIKKGSDEYKELVAKAAQRMKKDINDPEQLKDAETFVDKDLYIAKLKAELEAKTPSTLDEEAAAKINKAILGEEEPEAGKPAEEEKPKEAATSAFKWNSPSEILESEAGAWEAYKKGDPSKIYDFRNELFERQLARVEPGLRNFFNKILEERLGPILPKVQGMVQQNELSTARTEALEKVREVIPDIDELFKADGDPIQDNGRTFDNTPLNRILTANPEMREFVVPHKDPVTQEKLTHAKILQAVYRIHKGGKATDATKKAFDAGRKTAKRAASQKSRQGLNAGPGATTASGEQEEDYATQLAKGQKGNWAKAKVQYDT